MAEEEWAVGRNSGRDTAETAENTETAPDKRGMGQELTDNRVPNDGTLPEIAKAGMEKEASSALLEKEKDTYDATAVPNLESEEPQSKISNSVEKKDPEPALDRRGKGQKTSGKGRKFRDITGPVFGTRVFASIASSSRGQDYSAVPVVNRNSSREAAQPTVNSESDQERRGMGQISTYNRMLKFDTLPETMEAGTVKEASSALPEKGKDTWDATTVTNHESGEKKVSESSINRTGTGHKVAKDSSLPEGTRVFAGIASYSRGQDYSAVPAVNQNSSREAAQPTVNSETDQERRGMGQVSTYNRMLKFGTLPETIEAGTEKEASSALPEKGKDTWDATAVPNLESGEKKVPKSSINRTGMGHKVAKDSSLPEGTRVFAGIASSSRGQDYSAVPVVNRNSSREAAQPTVNSETDQERQGMGQVSTHNRMLKFGTIPETMEAGTEKEASSALLEKEKDTSDATAVPNLESEEPQSKISNSGEKKDPEPALDRRGKGQKTSGKERKSRDITEPVIDTRVFPSIASSSRGQDYSAVPDVNRNSSREAAQPTVNSETDQERRGMGQVSTYNRMLEFGTLPETVEAGMEKEASSALPEKGKDTWDATSVTKHESGEKKVSESSINRTGMGHKVAEDSSLPESEKGSLGEEASANPEIGSQAGAGESRNDAVQSASGEADDSSLPWVPQSDGIEVYGASGERLSAEQTTEIIDLKKYGADERRSGWGPKLIESDEEE